MPVDDWPSIKRELVDSRGALLTRFLFDTAIFVYAVGVEHPRRAPCRAIVREADAGRLRGEASVDIVEELAHQRMRRTGDRADAVRQARAVAGLCRLRAVTPSIAIAALDVLEGQLPAHGSGRDVRRPGGGSRHRGDPDPGSRLRRA